ncbi:MAG TPA: isoprenylcysteine carboxylmethyltransferase family protein, partial [Kofleriaceae bacterium]|nr:isoprenylcysteine carboxylmethyltransferase family protein [Kofleriaceae bacterium]
MNLALFVLSFLGFLLMFSLPRIFFRADGRKHLRWWITGAPFGLATIGLWLAWFGISPHLTSGAALAAVLDIIGMLATVVAIALIAATLATHRVPLALWHQDGEQNAPMHIVTYGPYGFVRHPFYVSFILLLVGAAFIARDMVTLAALPLGVLVLDWT